MERAPGYNPEELNVKSTESEQEEQVEKLFGHCFEIKQFENNDTIPVGGESIFAQEANITIKGDFAEFEDLYQQIHENASQYNLTQLRNLLDEKNISISEETVAKLFAFNRIYGDKYPSNPEAAGHRREYYHQRENQTLKLSEVIRENMAECAEIAAISKYYLQTEGVDTSYFSGDVLWNKEFEFSEEHSFILLRDKDNVYIYDPANPVKAADEKLYPSIYVTEANFDEEVRKDRKRFIAAKNIIFETEAYFGVNNGTNVDQEKDIIY